MQPQVISSFSQPILVENKSIIPLERLEHKHQLHRLSQIASFFDL
jgi:hypothetical protein